jgi:hypothetical protein
MAMLLISSRAAQAQSIAYLRGVDHSTTTSQSDVAYKVEYRQKIRGAFSATFDYVNEGHFTGHHPDGYGLEAWYRLPLSAVDHLALLAGAGGFYYFDTVTPPGGSSSDVHGLAPRISVTLRGKVWHQWDWVVSADAMRPTRSVRTAMVTAGLSYWLEGDPAHPEAEPVALFERAARIEDHDRALRNEWSLLGALSVINISGNPNSIGGSAEYRHRFDWSHGPYEASIAYIYEGDPRVARRHGVTLQVWPVRTDLVSRIEIGAGFGAYVFVDTKDQLIPGQITSAAVAPVVSLMASVPVTDAWFVRAIWDRVVSNYNRDADIWRLGFGRRF